MSLKLHELQGFLVDLDGVLFRGSEPIPGAADFLRFLQEQELPFAIVTNNSTQTVNQYVDKIGELGVIITANEVVTSSRVAAESISRTASDSDRVFMIGSTGLEQALRAANLQLTEDYTEASYVVVGLDRSVNYDRLAKASLAVGRGAKFLGTNADLSFPSERGSEPGAGALLAVIEAASGIAPKIFGKPEPDLFKEGLQRLDLDAARTAMIGDRHETDIVGAQRSGLTTIAVASGALSRAQLEQREPPADYLFDSVAGLHEALRRH